MSHRFALFVVSASWLTLVPVLASADEDSADAYQQMLDLSNEAAEAVADDQFEFGAVKFRQAYDHYPDPVLLNNEMIAWYRADDCRNALTPARTFLELDSEDRDDIAAEDRQNVRTVMVECHLQLAQESLDRDQITLASYHLEILSPIELDDDDQTNYQALRDELDDRPRDVAIEPVTGPVTDGSASSNHLGWAQIAGGIALAGVGLSMHTVALSRQSHLQELSSTNADLFEQRRSDWSGYQNTARWAVPALYVIGAGAIGSGTYFLLRDDSDSGSMAVSPTVTGDQTGLTVTGRF